MPDLAKPNWLKLNPKIRTALAIVLTADAASSVAQLEGDGLGWRFVIGGAIISGVGLIGGYLQGADS